MHAEDGIFYRDCITRQDIFKMIYEACAWAEKAFDGKNRSKFRREYVF